ADSAEPWLESVPAAEVLVASNGHSPIAPIVHQPVAPVIEEEEALPASTARGVIAPELLEELLKDHPGSELDAGDTTLLMKQFGLKSQSQLRWGPIVVLPNGQWDARAGGLPEDAQSLISTLIRFTKLEKPYVLHVAQVPLRA